MKYYIYANIDEFLAGIWPLAGCLYAPENWKKNILKRKRKSQLLIVPINESGRSNCKNWWRLT